MPRPSGATALSSRVNPALREPMPQQRRALKWALPFDDIALFMEMRLGKTLVAIRWAQHWKPKRVLVLAPSTVLPVWKRELALEGEEGIVLTGTRPQRAEQAANGDGWFLLNFEGLVYPVPKGKDKKRAPVVAPIADMQWDVVLIDESTRIRNPGARLTKACMRKFEDAEHICVMSGYPAPEGPLDYFCQMATLYGEFLNCDSWWAMRQRYFRQMPPPFQYEWIAKRGAIQEIKEEVHRLAFVMTRREAGIGSKKIYETREIPMNDKQKAAVKQIEKDFELTLQSGETIEYKYIVQIGTALARIAGGFDPEGDLLSAAKIKEVVTLLEGELKGSQVVIWFRYNWELVQMGEQLKRRKIPFTYIIGKTKQHLRERRITGFNNSRYQVMLMQIKCGSLGLDLSTASTAIYYSNGYEGEHRVQSEDRIVHPQKKEPLLIMDLVTEGTVDEDVVAAVKDKMAVGKRFMAKLLETRYGIKKG